MAVADLLQKKWDLLKEEIERLHLAPQSESVRKKIRFLKNEASIIKFAIEDTKAGLPREVVLENLKSNRLFYLKLKSKK